MALAAQLFRTFRSAEKFSSNRGQGCKWGSISCWLPIPGVSSSLFSALWDPEEAAPGKDSHACSDQPHRHTRHELTQELGRTEDMGRRWSACPPCKKWESPEEECAEVG